MDESAKRFQETFPIDPNQADVWHPNAREILKIDTGLANDKKRKDRQFVLTNEARRRADRRLTAWRRIVSQIKSDTTGGWDDVFALETANDNAGWFGLGRKRNTRPLRLQSGWIADPTNLEHDFSRPAKDDE